MRRGFTSRPRDFSMQAIEEKWAEQRFDKAVMAKLGLPWSDVHRHVREKQIFVARGGKDIEESERYVTR